MIWWLAAAFTLGVLGVANAILKRLQQTATVERKRWQNEYQQLENELLHYERQIQQKIRQAQHTVDFHQLTQLHYESMKVANRAYMLLADARVALDALGIAIRDAGREKNRLIAEKRQAWNPFRKQQLEQEIVALIELRTQLFPDKDQLKAQRDRFHTEVKRLNAQTHALKIAIRDRCGPQGQDWYERLEKRTERKKLGLPPDPSLTGGKKHLPEVRVRGVVKWYDASKGFGFIIPADGGGDIYVGRKNLRGVRSLQEGDMVEFSVRQGNQGPWAFGVTKV